PAFSIRSPTRTISPVTLTVARRTGALICVSASPASADIAVEASRAAARTSEWAVRVIMAISLQASAEQRGGGLHHLVGGGDDLGVHLVGALGGDQLAHFAHDVDIG